MFLTRTAMAPLPETKNYRDRFMAVRRTKHFRLRNPRKYVAPDTRGRTRPLPPPLPSSRWLFLETLSRRRGRHLPTCSPLSAPSMKTMKDGFCVITSGDSDSSDNACNRNCGRGRARDRSGERRLSAMLLTKWKKVACFMIDGGKAEQTSRSYPDTRVSKFARERGNGDVMLRQNGWGDGNAYAYVYVCVLCEHLGVPREVVAVLIPDDFRAPLRRDEFLVLVEHQQGWEGRNAEQLRDGASGLALERHRQPRHVPHVAASRRFLSGQDSREPMLICIFTPQKVRSLQEQRFVSSEKTQVRWNCPVWPHKFVPKRWRLRGKNHDYPPHHLTKALENLTQD